MSKKTKTFPLPLSSVMGRSSFEKPDYFGNRSRFDSVTVDGRPGKRKTDVPESKPVRFQGAGLKFNLAFLPKFFSTGYKYGWALLLGIVCFVVGYLVMETIVQAVPTVKAIFDGYNEQYLWARAAAAVVALGAYVGLTFAANNIAVKKFEKVNL